MKQFLKDTWFKIVITVALICFFLAFLSLSMLNKSENIIIKDYDDYVDILNVKCPFQGTAATSDCLDKLTVDKEKELKNLITKITEDAQAKTETPEGILLLSELPKYNELWGDYSESFCAIVVSNEGGSGVVEASRKCKLFQIEQYIQLLKNQEDWINP